jgi:hypothetical protein
MMAEVHAPGVRFLPEFRCSSPSADEAYVLQNELHIAHTSPLSGKTQKVMKVRIPLAPPHSLGCRETRLHSRQNCEKSPQFCDSLPETGSEKVSR